MSFELGLRGTHQGPPRRARNPFTGVMGTENPLVMRDDELHAALAVIARHGTLDEDGGGILDLSAAKIEFSSFGAEGDLVKVSGDLARACEFLFELATAGQIAVVILSAGDDEPASLVTTANALARAGAVEEELGSASLVESPSELASILAPHHAHATKYAARVTGGR